jgi:hypothetical protein
MCFAPSMPYVNLRTPLTRPICHVYSDWTVFLRDWTKPPIWASGDLIGDYSFAYVLIFGYVPDQNPSGEGNLGALNVCR